MGLFERFHETIFLKEDSELETRIEKLKEIKEQVKDKKGLEKELILLEKGRQGEKEIAFELKNAAIGMYVLHDINIPYKDLTAQIDYVVVTPAYCYLIECKNLIGNVTVNKEGEFKREYTLDGKTIKEAIYSPYTQAARHKEIFKKRWLDKNSNLTNLLFEKTFDNYYKPLVVFANSKGLLNIKDAPKEIKENIIRVDQLIDYMKKDLALKDWTDVSTKNQMKECAESILKIHQSIEKDDIKNIYRRTSSSIRN